MQTQKRIVMIVKELKSHAPFTLFGAAIGILCMFLFKNFGSEINHRLFQVFHPAHVILSAIVTASLFKLHKGKSSFLVILLVGYFGSIGIATLSDCVFPFFGETILGVAVPVHSESHSHDPADDQTPRDEQVEYTHQIRPKLYLGFIEDWYLVNPAALLGIIIAFLWPHTKFPHAGHVLVSTWASSFHVLMNTHRELSFMMIIGIFIVLFIAVWLPCCVSDIVFPLLLVKSSDDLSQFYHHHQSDTVSL
ncbi:MAG: hypothetical protein JW837_01680 [Sedimentisphaerales bacterium]|nr:hypothetical protein [Sedimentisphaerales bacterium]